MPAVHIEVRHRHRWQTFRVGRKRIVVGSGDDCGLRIPLPQVKPRHLVLDCGGQVLRVRTCSEDAPASIDGRQLGPQWTVLPAQAEVQIPADDAPIRIQVRAQAAPAALLAQPAQRARPDDDFSVHIVTDSGVAHEVRHTPLTSPAADAPPVHEPAPRSKGLPRIVLVAILVVCCMIAGALVWDQVRRARQRGRLGDDLAFVQQKLSQVHELLGGQEYAAAAAALDAAEPVARRWPSMSPMLEEIESIRQRPAIQFGARGYVQIGSEWYPPDIAEAWRQARERDDPRIAAAIEAASLAIAQRRWEDGQVVCDEALALMDAHPIKPHPSRARIETLRSTCRNELVAAEMTAKGLVLVEGLWVTKDEAFRLEQLSKGLVEYRGQWMTKSEAFAAEQRDKGLVFHDGRWMTREQKLISQGFVEFEGQWVREAERTAILERRAREAELERQRREAEQQRLAAEQKRQREEAARMAQLREQAYLMSQVFIKRQLKAPASARFEPFSSDDVMVLYSDGWFLVRAPVDAQNSFGAMLRSTYLCKLRPIAGDRWEAELAVLLD